MPTLDLLPLLTALLASPLLYIVLFLACALDGFFPPVPSETILVAIVAAGVATGQPPVVVVAVVAAAGAVLGDTLAFLIGRRVGLTRFRWMRRPRVAAALERASDAVTRRPAGLVLTARFVPVGRMIVNLAAGASGLPLRRFVPIAALAGLAWAAYSVFVGTIASAWAANDPILAVILAVVLATVIGAAVDLLPRLIRHRLSSRRAAGSIASETPPASPAGDLVQP